MEYKIRELTQVDLPLLKQIYEQSIRVDYLEFSEKIKDFMIQGQYAEFSLRQPMQLGAFDDEKMVAFLLGDKHFGGVRYILSLSVGKDYQRKGIGSSLLKKFEQISLVQGAHCIVLETFPRDIDFYKKNGYEFIGVNTKGYFGLDNYNMKKAIAEPDEEKFLT